MRLLPVIGPPCVLCLFLLPLLSFPSLSPETDPGAMPHERWSFLGSFRRIRRRRLLQVIFFHVIAQWRALRSTFFPRYLARDVRDARGRLRDDPVSASFLRLPFSDETSVGPFDSFGTHVA